MSFKVGDIVRVKDYKDINCFTFVPGMKCYCGHKYIITEIKLYPDGNVYKLNCGADFTFEEKCLEKLLQALSQEIKIIHLHSTLKRRIKK